MKTSFKFVFPIILFMVFGMTRGVSLSDSIAPNKPRDFFSQNGKYRFHVCPFSQYGTLGAGALMTNDSSPQILWRVDWYASDVRPLNDGVRLVRLGEWATDYKRLEDLAVAFYVNGKEVRRYLVRDFRIERRFLRRTVSHYFWLAERKFSADERYLMLTLLDGRKLMFSTADGELIKEYPAPMPGHVLPNESQEDALRLCNSSLVKDLLADAEEYTQREKYESALRLYQHAFRLCPDPSLEEQMAWLRSQIPPK